jgi:hypothetical protein
MRAYSDHPGGVACNVLGLDRDAARDLLRAFEAAGYVRHIGKETPTAGDWWVTAIQGRPVPAKPISRATARVIWRRSSSGARGYNADPSRLLAVTQIAVFESYLDPTAVRIGDLELAVSAVRRETNGDRYVRKAWRDRPLFAGAQRRLRMA